MPEFGHILFFTTLWMAAGTAFWGVIVLKSLRFESTPAPEGEIPPLGLRPARPPRVLHGARPGDRVSVALLQSVDVTTLSVISRN